jgi:hypothetical protein
MSSHENNQQKAEEVKEDEREEEKGCMRAEYTRRRK